MTIALAAARGRFGYAWALRHDEDDDYPVDTFEQWFAEWKDTRIDAGRWLDARARAPRTNATQTAPEWKVAEIEAEIERVPSAV